MRSNQSGLFGLSEQTCGFIAAGIVVACWSGFNIVSRLGSKGVLTPFDLAAYAVIHRASGGLPRLINTICDNALFEGALARTPVIGVDLVRAVCYNLALPIDDPAEQVPGQSIVLPEHPGQLRAAEVDLNRLRRSLIHRALTDSKDMPGEADLAFLAAETRTSPAFVRQVITQLLEDDNETK